MLEHHETILRELDCLSSPDGEMCIPFAPLQDSTGMTRTEVRRIVRHLARRGYAEFYKTLWSEDKGPAGAGYCITRKGRAFLREKDNDQ